MALLTCRAAVPSRMESSLELRRRHVSTSLLSWLVDACRTASTELDGDEKDRRG